MNVIDLFSGVGGFSTGLRLAGFDIIMANEIDKQIANSYKMNHIDTLMINDDISNLIDNYDNLVEKNLILQNINQNLFKKGVDNIDLIIGGPPCQGFSMAGARIRKKSQFIEDSRNYLFKQYFRMIQKYEPNFFIFENVSGILTMNNGEIIKEIEAIFRDESNFKSGPYYLQKKIFCADDYGIPQKRKRLILIGSKIPFDLDETIKKTLLTMSLEKKILFTNKCTIYDAIADLNFENIDFYVEGQEYILPCESTYQKYLKSDSKLIFNHKIPTHSKLVLDRIKRIKPGQNWRDLDESKSIKSVHSGAYGRLNWNDLAVTITTRFDTPSGGRFIHPTLNRNITPREAARIQSFPDNFIFYGNKSSICKQIGNAVPPMLAEFLGYLIRNIS